MVEPSFLALTRTPSITGSWADDTLPLNAAVVCACVDASPPPKLAVRLRLASSQNCLQCMFTSRNRFWHSMAYPVAHGQRAQNANGRGEPRPSQFCEVCGTSVERLDLHDRRSVIAADPEHRAAAGLFDEDAAHIGASGQEVIDDLTGLGIEPRYLVGRHRTGPHFAGVFAWHDVIGSGPRRRQRVLFDGCGLRVEHPDAVAAILSEPETVLRI